MKIILHKFEVSFKLYIIRIFSLGTKFAYIDLYTSLNL